MYLSHFRLCAFLLISKYNRQRTAICASIIVALVRRNVSSTFATRATEYCCTSRAVSASSSSSPLEEHWCNSAMCASHSLAVNSTMLSRSSSLFDLHCLHNRTIDRTLIWWFDFSARFTYANQLQSSERVVRSATSTKIVKGIKNCVSSFEMCYVVAT